MITPLCDGRGCTRVSIATVGAGPLPLRLCAGCEHELATAGTLDLKTGQITTTGPDQHVPGLA